MHELDLLLSAVLREMRCPSKRPGEPNESQVRAVEDDTEVWCIRFDDTMLTTPLPFRL